MLEQGSAEWLEVRRNCIGASDAPSIMGVSPWRSMYKLWEQKTGVKPETERNFFMDRGIRIEPLARECFSQKIGLDFLPVVLFHDEFDWMIASLDGYNFLEGVAVEIKCAGAKDHGAALEGKIPEKYIPQLQHQMAVANLQEIYYFSFDGHDGVSIILKRDDEYLEKLISNEIYFLDCVRNFNPPDKKDLIK